MLDKFLYYLKRIVIGGAICLGVPCALALIGTIPWIAINGIQEWVFWDVVNSGLMTVMICMMLFFVGGIFDYMWKNYGK
jgi:hypothetical protein